MNSKRNLHSALLNYVNEPTVNRRTSLINALNKYFYRSNITTYSTNITKSSNNGPWIRNVNGKSVYTSTNRKNNNIYYNRINNSNVYERNVNGQKKKYRWSGTNFEELNNRPNKTQPWEVNVNGQKYYTNRNKTNLYKKNNFGRYYKKNTNKQYHWNPNTNKFTNVIILGPTNQSLINQSMNMPAIKNANNQPWKKVLKNGTSVYTNRPNSNNRYIKTGVNKYTKNNKYYQWMKGTKEFKEINKNIFNLLQ